LQHQLQEAKKRQEEAKREERIEAQRKKEEAEKRKRQEEEENKKRAEQEKRRIQEEEERKKRVRFSTDLSFAQKSHLGGDRSISAEKARGQTRKISSIEQTQVKSKHTPNINNSKTAPTCSSWASVIISGSTRNA
jgi:trichohyalin